jgi:Icc-related predicted phosphoesterase
MVKILAIGDFHGKFPAKLKKIAKSREIGLILSTGDYFPFFYRELWFKHCYASSSELWEFIGKSKTKKLVTKDLKKGEAVLKELNKIGKPVLSVVGNVDYANLNDQYPKKGWTRKKGWWWYEQDFFSKIIKKYKKTKRIDYSFARVGGLIFIGGFGHTSPGFVKSTAYKKHRRKLDRLFKKFKRKNKTGKVIFLFHNMPYKCGTIDKIRDKKADKRVLGKHYGSKLTKRIIQTYQPVLGIGGHLHENQGKSKIGETLVINTGAACEGRAAIIDFDEDRGKIKNVKFIK